MNFLSKHHKCCEPEIENIIKDYERDNENETVYIQV